MHGIQFDASSRVVLPEKNGLVVDKLAALRIDNLSPEVFVLQQIQEVQAHRVFQVTGIVGLFPIQ